MFSGFINKVRLRQLINPINNLNHVGLDNPNNIWPAMDRLLTVSKESAENAAPDQLTVIFMGEKHRAASHIFGLNIVATQLHKQGFNPYVAIEMPHNFVESSHLPVGLQANAQGKGGRYAPYSHFFLMDQLWQKNIVHDFVDCIRDKRLLKPDDPSTQEAIKLSKELMAGQEDHENINPDDHIHAESRQGVLARNIHMLSMAFNQAVQKGHRTLIMSTGAAHLWGGLGDHPYGYSMNGLIEAGFFEKIIQQPNVINFVEHDILRFVNPDEEAYPDIPQAIVPLGMNDQLFKLPDKENYEDFDQYFEDWYSTFEEEQSTLNDIWHASHQPCGAPPCAKPKQTMLEMLGAAIAEKDRREACMAKAPAIA